MIVVNKFEELEEIKIISTNEIGTIVDIYEANEQWYYQIELKNKTPERDIIECGENEIEKIDAE